MKKLGLALSGGGLRGFAHIGVLQILEENQVPVSMISGTSAGSIITALYASGMSPRAMEEVALSLSVSDYIDYNWRGLLQYLISLRYPRLKSDFDGFVRGDRLERMIYELTQGKSLQDCKIPLAIVACDINTGKKVVFSNRPIGKDDPDQELVSIAWLSEASRASSAIPGVFTPKDVGDMQLVDGGVCDMVPVIEQKALGAEYILAVNLGDKNYDQEVRGMIPVITRSLNILEYETSHLAEELYADLVITPATGDVHLDDLSQTASLIRSGRRAMKANLNQLLDGLNQSGNRKRLAFI
ncbi:MAG TPA: patatin-like phospholipase family protein [Syntrophomonadaceae bacterium]|nr:patatin-like phospholipase family protein [Syntrophomonadaceae bacterium]